AEKALEALKKLVVPTAKVIRNGKLKEVPAKDLVPGDVVILEEGDKVPADCRIVEAFELKVDESSLTGESIPVFKSVEKLRKEDLPASERRNMVFMGTVVVYGRGKAIVVATGSHTEIGKIAKMIQEPKEETPLQRKLDEFGKKLGIFVVILCAITFVVGLFIYKTSITEMFLLSIALAVAAVPEGLPAVVTITLALGMQRMVRRNAIVKRLSAVETLGSVTVICADKTGTMTTNEMTVRKIWVNGKTYDVTGVGFEPKGEILLDGKRIDIKNHKELIKLVKIGFNCNNSKIEEPNVITPYWHVIGDPTEGALITLAEKTGLNLYEKRIFELPFSSERKMMTTINEDEKGNVYAYVKGAPEILLKRSSHILKNGKIKRLTESERKQIIETIHSMANEGLRVLGFAFRKVRKKKKYKEKEVEKNLVFVGLAGMIDPPRKEVKDSIKACKEAGIKVVMITGDHKSTALAVARELGIIEDDEENVLTGEDLEAMSDQDLIDVVEEVNVYARVSPLQKMKILKAFKAKGHIVAMTGDGVNDAPALKKADIGIAMGIKGTEVAKEAADIILMDDNFATIVAAIEEGRGIFDNIKKFIRYMLSANFGEIFTITIAGFFGLPLPLLPIHMLWINLITDGLPAVALSVDPPEKDIMKRKPRDPKESILANTFWFMLVGSAVVTFSTILVFSTDLVATRSLNEARAVAFTTMTFFELLFVLNCRSEKHSVFTNPPWTNKKLLLAIVASMILQGIIIYTPFLQTVFKIAPLTLYDWIRVFMFSGIALLILPKFFIPSRTKRE
ncbi:MAG: calcium-translocating P-type ATPase, SERCA-type, partial [Candidatus Aenigmarchaeota archaeon]|nr:calcium-translocating P-type ATPase, SERCA-type [Candidatus Aenigmarchaeota archaeon]